MLKVHHREPSNLQHFLQGGIIGGSIKGSSNNLIKFHNLVGKTLIFTLPLKTITFIAVPNQDYLTASDIKTRIETVEVTLRVTFIGGRLAVNKVTPGIGINLNKTGTANQILGFSKNKITLGVFYNEPAGIAPKIITVHPIDQGRLQIITDE